MTDENEEAGEAVSDAIESTPENFEQALEALEKLVRELEDGKLSLEESVTAYERGMQLHLYCQKALQVAQARVMVLSNADSADGDNHHDVALEPFAPAREPNDP